MRCVNCGATLPDGNVYCNNCGARLADAAPFAPASTANEPPAVSPNHWQATLPTAPSTFPPPLSAPESYMPDTSSSRPYVSEPGWAEFSGVQAPPSISAGHGLGQPPILPESDAYGSAGQYPYSPGSVPSGFPPPVAPKRRGWLISLGVLLVLLLIVGGVFAGIAIGQSHGGVAPAQTAATSVANPTPDAARIFQQVTGRQPAIVESLQHSTDEWSSFEEPLYGCEIKSDGLHVHIKDPRHYTTCNSGQGSFGNFAFQVEMNILSGVGGGIAFRSDNTGDYYFFHIYPDGRYDVYLSQNHQLSKQLGAGVSSTFSPGFARVNTLTVIAQGSQIYFYVNQKPIEQLLDSTYAAGYIGVLAEDADTPADVVYTNAKIWNL